MDKSINKIFNEDCIEKKLIAKGIHNRISRKKGFKGGIIFPVDLLKGKKKKEYMGNSEVRTYNMYETIMPYGEFKSLKEVDKKELLINYLKHHSRKEIASEWGVQIQSIHDLVYRLKLTNKSSKKVTKDKNLNTQKTKTLNDSLVQLSENLQLNTKAHETSIDNKKLLNVSFSMELSGLMNGNEFFDRLMRIIEMTVKEKQYYIDFELKEISTIG